MFELPSLFDCLPEPRIEAQILPGDIENTRAMLPFLFPTQVEVYAGNYKEFRRIDISYIAGIAEFFEVIEHLEF